MGVGTGDHLPGRHHLLEGLRSAHEGERLDDGERGGKRDGGEPDRGRDGLPAHDARFDRIGEPLQRERPNGIELISTAGASKHPHEGRHEDLAALRSTTQTRRLDHGCAEQIVPLASSITRADPDTELDLIETSHRLLDRDRRADRIGRASERGHVTVAEALHQHSLIASRQRPRRPSRWR